MRHERRKMKREVGLWIDRQKTVMVTVLGEIEETLEIRSNVGKLVKPLTKLHAQIPIVSRKENVDTVQNDEGSYLSGYLDGVVSMLRNADLIWIFGPGDVKHELKKRLERVDLGERIVRVEAVNKMTNRQIIAKVRQHYLQ
jgi:hypothetical protein